VGTRGREPAPTETQAVFDEAVGNLTVAIEESGAQVTADPLPAVTGDHQQLVQVFQNLIGNAIKFHGDQPPRVHVGAAESNGEWVFTVRDNGIGIDPNYFDRIFVIFQRLHGKDDFPGTGIGLALCKKIVARHGGRIWVDSAAGDGSTFHFTIPIQGGSPQ
jgi:two-component system, chemotaxis family, sensor kinase Cph1